MAQDAAAPLPAAHERARGAGWTVETGAPEAIASSEGVSLDYIMRARLQFLAAQHTSQITQTQFADAKAATLMTLFGIVAARLAIGWPDLPEARMVASALLLMKGAVLICCLLVISPRIPRRGAGEALLRVDRFSWPALASDDVDGDSYAAFMRGSQSSDLISSMARSNVHTARILRWKFRMLRAAFAIAVIDAVVMTAALGAGVALL